MALTVINFMDRLTGSLAGLEDSAGDLRKYVRGLFNKANILQVPTDADGDFTMAAQSLFRVDRDITVVSAYFIAAAALTADNTNNTTLKLNKADGAGGAETIVASWLTNVAGGSGVAFVPKLLTNSGTAANLNVDAGQILGVVGTKGGTGVTLPAGVMVVNYRER